MKIIIPLHVVLWFCLLLPMLLMAQQEAKTYSFCPSSPVVKDHEGNMYRTVQIGTQCWMAENMRCTTSPSGHKWHSNPYFTAAQPDYAAYFATPADLRHGILYNWTAAVDLPAHQNNSRSVAMPVRGICPQGWHLPSTDEWDLLFNTLGGKKVAGEMMKAPSQQWDPYLSIHRENSGFDAIPSGSYTEDGHKYVGMQSYFWSAENFNRSQAWCCILYDFKNEGYNYLDYKCYGHSVRCLKDN